MPMSEWEIEQYLIDHADEIEFNTSDPINIKENIDPAFLPTGKVSFEQLDPASPNSRKMGVPKDNKDTINSNTRMDPEEYGKLKHIIEHNLDSRFNSQSEFVRHYVSYGIAETLRRSSEGAYSDKYETSVAMRAAIEHFKEVDQQLSWLDEIEQRWNKSNCDISIFEEVRPQLEIWMNKAISPRIRNRILAIFPQLRG